METRVTSRSVSLKHRRVLLTQVHVFVWKCIFSLKSLVLEFQLNDSVPPLSVLRHPWPNASCGQGCGALQCSAVPALQFRRAARNEVGNY